MLKAGIKNVITLSATWLLLGCSPPAGEAPPPPRQPNYYFSLQEYFERETSRLQRASPLVSKTVVKDEVHENQNIHIKNWKNELELYISSDINKEAWKNSYSKDSTAERIIYKRLDPELRTKLILINKWEDGTIRHIHITNETENMLYRSYERLDYYPDSLYDIRKVQDVRVVGKNSYRVTGVIKT